MYSFKDTNPGGFAYLEEDCDAPDFINNYADEVKHHDQGVPRRLLQSL